MRENNVKEFEVRKRKEQIDSELTISTQCDSSSTYRCRYTEWVCRQQYTFFQLLRVIAHRGIALPCCGYWRSLPRLHTSCSLDVYACICFSAADAVRFAWFFYVFD
uniref:Uncharacterized protein n=1 Tax=Rhipicephalus microplus TaxID=6941 RepID=A0A6G5AI17_RHIMP